MNRMIISALLFWSLAILPHAAQADDTGPVAIMQCDGQHNRMLLRLGDNDAGFDDPASAIRTAKFAPIPKAMAESWQHIPLKLAGTCHFQDGQTVKVTPSYGQAPAGVDPPGYFTLAIQHHLIYADYPYYGGGYDRASPGATLTASAPSSMTGIFCSNAAPVSPPPEPITTSARAVPPTPPARTSPTGFCQVTNT